MSSSTWTGYGPAASGQGPASQLQRAGSGDRTKKPQSRQLLSCTKCRERKVKCDRTKPCSACCARGHPKACEFVVGEGNDYSPIQQSYEIRKLRAENQRLKERLQNARLAQSGDEDDDEESSDRKTSKASSRAAGSRQRRFKTGDRIDNLYFGTPGLANIVADFANLQLGSQSLTHTIPRGRDIYIHEDVQSFYPFSILWPGGTTARDMARDLLPEQDEIFRCLDMFQKRAQSCYFPHTPDELTKREVERFLEQAEDNAERYPDMLALIFSTLATAMQMSVYDRFGAWVAGAVEQSRSQSDVYIAAAMQALRLASFMNTPTLLGIQTLVMIGPYLTNSGRFLDAWTLFGTTIRVAHSIGLHRDPKVLEPPPPLRESMIRRTLWWWMLHMDQQYSVTLGRPLGISGFGDCPPPEPLTTNPTILRLNEFVDHFTILARQILSSDGMMNVGRIDEYTDKLLGLWDTMPEALQFNENWLQPTTSLPEWPLEVMSAMLYAKVQSFLILLNRQRLERTQGIPNEHSPPGSMAPPPPPPPRPTMTSSSYGDQPLHPAPLRGRSLVVNSSIALVNAFMFFQYRKPEVLICWTMGQQCFNACMILILDAWETENEQNLWLVNQAFAVFSDLQKNGVHKLAELAVQRISRGLVLLGQRKEQRSRQSAASRGTGYNPQLQVDTASMTDFHNDTVMGNTGMFLLEDTGLQSYIPPAFAPLGWHMAGSAHHSNASNPTTPNIPSPIVPVSQIAAAPFPAVMSPPYSSTMTQSPPFMPGLQPHMQHSQPNQRALSSSSHQAAFTPINTNMPLGPIQASYNRSSQQQHQQQQQQQQLSPLEQQIQQSFSQVRGPRHSYHRTHTHHSSHRTHHASSGQNYQQGTGAGPRGIHRLDRVPKSQQRKK